MSHALHTRNVMDRAIGKTDVTKPFGTFAPTGAAARLIKVARKTPMGRGKARKILYRRLIAMDQDVYDMDVRGVNMRLHPKTNTVESKLVLRPDAYCPEEMRFLEKTLTGKLDFVDIGANIGAFAVQVATRTGARTLAFEPNPTSRARLSENAAINPQADITIDPRALSDKRETVQFRSVDTDLKVSGFDLERYDGTTIDVETVPLIEALDEHGFINGWGMKIDVEGHEDAVLDPFFATASQDRWPRFVIIEAIEREGLPGVLQTMKSLGYTEAFRNRANMGLVLA